MDPLELNNNQKTPENESKNSLIEVVYKPFLESENHGDVSTLLKMECQKSEDNSQNNLFLFVCAIFANLITFSSGIGYGWSSPVVPKLAGAVDPENNPLSTPSTVQQDSWIASLISLGALLSPCITVFISDIIGRKKTLLIFAAPTIVSHIICMFATEVYQFYIARFLMGMGIGCMFTVVPVYGAEISQKHNRGLIGLIMNMNLATGQLFAVAIGPYLTIRLLSIVFLIPSIFFVVLFGFFAPETPYFFALRSKTKNVEESLKKLRGKQYSDSELAEVLKSAESNSKTEKGGLKDLITTKHHLKILFKVVGVMFFKQMTGLVFVALYTQKIFSFASTGLSAEMLVILVNLIQVLAVFFAATVIERFPRKTLMIYSLGLMGVADLAISIYFYYQSKGYNTEYTFWVPIVCTCLLFTLFNMGICPLSFTFAAEIFEHKVKSWGMTFGISANLLTAFLSTSILPNTAERYGFYMPFLIFAVTALIGVAFIWFFIPETKGKSFLEIHNAMRKK